MSLDDQTLIKPYVQVKGHYNNSRGYVLDDGRFMFLDGETLVTLSEATGRMEEPLPHGLTGRVRVVANGEGTTVAAVGHVQVVVFKRQDGKWVETRRYESPEGSNDPIVGGTTGNILLPGRTDWDHLVVAGKSKAYPCGNYLTMAANGQVAAYLDHNNGKTGRIIIINPSNGEVIQTIQEPKVLDVGAMSFSPNGAYLSVWLVTGALSVYETKSGLGFFGKDISYTFSPVISLAVPNDMSFVGVVTENDTFLYSTENGIWQPLHDVRTVRFLPDGTLVGHQASEMLQCRNGVTLWSPIK